MNAWWGVIAYMIAAMIFGWDDYVSKSTRARQIAQDERKRLGLPKPEVKTTSRRSRPPKMYLGARKRRRR